MRVLLTGGSGYIGSHTAVALAAAGHEPVLLDSYANSKPRVLDALQAIVGRPLDFVQADVRDADTVAATLAAQRIDAVIHLAGLKAVGESVSQPLRYYENNVGGSVALFAAMQRAEVFRLVFSSSAVVYGLPRALPIDESHPIAPTNPYGHTKAQVETILGSMEAADPRWAIVNLRYFNPVGAHESGLIGEDPRGVPNNLMPYMARVATGQLEALSVFGGDYDTPDGTGVRDYIHVMDIAEGHVRALDALRPGLRTYNLGAGRGFSVLELVRTFEAISGRPVPFRIGPRRPGDVASCYADVRKAEAELGWRSTRDLAAMCASVWRFQSQVDAAR